MNLFRYLIILIICSQFFICDDLLVSAKKKKKKGGSANDPLAKTQMIFINIRDEHVHPSGMHKMASDFQSIMQTGGLKVGITGIDPNQMIVVTTKIREGIEVRKFAT